MNIEDYLIDNHVDCDIRFPEEYGEKEERSQVIIPINNEESVEEKIELFKNILKKYNCRYIDIFWDSFNDKDGKNKKQIYIVYNSKLESLLSKLNDLNAKYTLDTLKYCYVVTVENNFSYDDTYKLFMYWAIVQNKLNVAENWYMERNYIIFTMFK